MLDVLLFLIPTILGIALIIWSITEKQYCLEDLHSELEDCIDFKAQINQQVLCGDLSFESGMYMVKQANKEEKRLLKLIRKHS